LVDIAKSSLYIVLRTFEEVDMLAIRLDKDLEKELDLLVKAKGSSRSAVVREALVHFLEDNEDLELARQALSEIRGSKTLTALRRDLGLDG
jgi:RHH-type rel operon transcriptional repressor/antitoxin RelB